MSRPVTGFYIIVSFFYALGFLCLEVALQSEGVSDSLIAILACSHNLISTVVCALIFFNAYKGLTGLIWSAGFLIVGIADVFHAVLHWVYPLPVASTVTMAAGELYTIFVLLHLAAMYRTFTIHKTKRGMVLVVSIAAIFFALTILCMTIPLLETELPFYYYFNITDLVYNAIVAMIVGMLIVEGLAAQHAAGLIFISSYLFVFSSGFALDFLSYLQAAGPKLSVFNYGWELGFSIMAATALWLSVNKRSLSELFATRPFNSLRFQVAALSLISILIFCFCLRLLEVPKSFWANTDISVLLSIFLIVWAATNAAALWLNKKVHSVEEILKHDELKPVPVQYEIDRILDVYRAKNRKLLEAGRCPGCS